MKKGHQRKPSQVEINAFKQLTKRDALYSLRDAFSRLKLTCPPDERDTAEADLNAYEHLFDRFISEVEGPVDWSGIKQIPDENVLRYDKLPHGQAISDLLNKIVVVKLNGGLGTSMGCEGPKSLIEVRNDLTFLDITIRQLEYLNKTNNCDIPLVLMNSFNTDDETAKIIQKYRHVGVTIHSFCQSRFPRIERETLLPIASSYRSSSNSEWYPPGHGDFYGKFAESGLLKRFIKEGKEYVFISNIDNLGATVDPTIVNYLFSDESKIDFLMELTDKTRADVKGGTLVIYNDRLRLLEIAQVPKEHVEEFKSVKTFKVFNTNNMWVRLQSIQSVLAQQKLHMEIIVNPKTLDNGINVIQLETASGAAIKSFQKAIGMNVPRSRFLPVKTTSDLLLVMSNIFVFEKTRLTMNPARSFPTVPIVRLGPNFKKVQDFLKRFERIPDCLELDSLTVAGDVTFGGQNKLSGTVIVIANHGERIDIPPGAILENKIVSGNLRILEH
ncbi:hypothetical protein ACOME3_006004 [Neoechinorhynchus agilis]